MARERSRADWVTLGVTPRPLPAWTWENGWSMMPRGGDSEPGDPEVRQTCLFPLPPPFHKDLLCEGHRANCRSAEIRDTGPASGHTDRRGDGRVNVRLPYSQARGAER